MLRLALLSALALCLVYKSAWEVPEVGFVVRL
jgi:hypothetical protein